MRFRQLPALYYIAFTIFISASVVSYQIYSLKSTADKITFIVTVMSLVVSTVAFYIAMKTYLSIDSVNVISQMEGNVLENENYVTSITGLLKDYDMDNSKDVGDAIYNNLVIRFEKQSKTAIEFATNLQYFIDLIVFFPSLFKQDDPNQKQNIEKVNKLLDLIEKRKKKLVSISNGNLILIEETVKLIHSVMHYQKLIHTNEYKITSSLLEVRGSMLRNAVTQTVYYNYLGLFYNKKAMYVLRQKLNLGNRDIFEIEALEEVKQNIHTLSGEELETFSMYLFESIRNFRKALDNCNEDVMWKGFIKYNDARSTYFYQLVNPGDDQGDWKVIMNEAISARGRLNLLIKDILEVNALTHLQNEFIYQEYLARLVKINMQIVEGQDISDTLDNPIYTYPYYEGLQNDRFVKHSYTGLVSKIRGYQKNILLYLEKV